MKKYILTIFLASLTRVLFAQWTNSSNSNNINNTNSGNVGIGLSSPAYLLDVNGTIRTNNVFLSTLTTGGVGLNVSNIANADFQIAISAQNATNKFAQIGSSVTNIPLLINPTNGGNVGIGTITPQAVFDVGKLLNSGDLGSVLARLSEGNTTGRGTYLGVKAYDTQLSQSVTDLNNVKSFAIEHSFYGVTNSSINFLRGASQNGGSIAFNTYDNTEKMRIAGNGNVGIGTINPDEKLTVYGNVHARGVKVDLNGPLADYVFDSDYKLKSLAELNNYIKANHHLPEIPSAQQAEKDGFARGKMYQLLLKKVEELTLYLIQKDKEINELKQSNLEIKQLRKEFEVLKDQLESQK